MFAFSGTLLVALLSVGQAPPQVEQVEGNALVARRTIRSGHFELKSNCLRNLDNGKTETRTRRLTIWLDGAKLRCDNWLNFGDQPANAPLHRQIDCIGCERPDSRLRYEGWGEGTTPIALYKTKPGEEPTTIDPRLLGMVPWEVPGISRYHLESFVRMASRNAPSIKADKWKGKDCWLISFTNKRNLPVNIWIVPEWGHSVARIETHDGIPGLSILDSVESEYKQTKSGLWFPSRCVYERHQNGKPWCREDSEIEVLKLNEPLSPSVFTLAGMGLPKGIYVMTDVIPGGLQVWDGTRLTPKPALPAETRRTPKASASGTWWRPMLLGSAVLFSLIAILLFWRYFRRAGNAGNSGVT